MKEELPKGWITGRLNEIVYSVKTGVPKYTGEKKYHSTGSIHNNTCESEGCYSFSNRPSRANRIARFNDVFQARMKETDKGLHIVKELAEQLFSTGFLQLRPFGETYLPKLLYYFTKSHVFLHQRDELATGSTQEALTDDNAKEIIFPLPSLNEQKHIAAKLDQIMPKIDGVEERLERIPQIIKRFRQSVLNAAVTGKLTEKWREGNIENEEGSAELEWQATNLGRISKYVTSGSRGWAKYYSDNGAIFIRAQNINTDVLDLSDVTYVNLPKKVEGKRTRIALDDILITITGANVTKTAHVTKSIGEAYVNQHVALVRLRDKRIAPYIYLWLISPISGRKQLEELAYGAGKPGLNLQNIKDVEVELPSIKEQHKIVRQVDNLFTFADKLEDHYQKAKEKIDKFPQSVLAKAFRGELVPQDPNDEPAEKLLERIQEEKAKMEAELKKTKKNVGRRKKAK